MSDDILTIDCSPLRVFLPWLFGRDVQKIADQWQRSRTRWAKSALTARSGKIQAHKANSDDDAEHIHEAKCVRAAMTTASVNKFALDCPGRYIS